MARVKMTVLIDENLKKEGRAYGVNFSRFLENQIREFLKREKGKQINNGGSEK